MHLAVRSRPHGFTLIELMVTVVIAGILAAVAYPAYTSHVMRSRRADATAALTAVVQAQERYRGNRSAFASSLDTLKIDVAAITPHYSVSIDNLPGAASLVSGYVVTATAKDSSPQRKDRDCRKLAIRVDGASVTYVASSDSDQVTSNTCWPR
jgi:type IV pilus assembly protein PilE